MTMEQNQNVLDALPQFPNVRLELIDIRFQVIEPFACLAEPDKVSRRRQHPGNRCVTVMGSLVIVIRILPLGVCMVIIPPPGKATKVGYDHDIQPA